MSTIAENLQVLNEAKANIKTALENKGVDMTDVPFTQYAEKIASIQASNKATIKDRINAIGADYLFYYANTTNEVVASLLSYDDTENAIQMTGMFRFSKGITHPPLFDTRKVGYAGNAFRSSDVEVIESYDFRSAYNLNDIVTDCPNLKECWIKNIKANLKVCSGEDYGHLLTPESLIHLIKELRDTGSTKTLAIGDVNLAKLTSTYVRVLADGEISDEMRAEDDLIDEKLPFAICESTDEGAMHIVDYAKLKNWDVV